MKVSGYKTGPYHKEIGLRLTKCFKSSNIIIGLWIFQVRIEWSSK